MYKFFCLIIGYLMFISVFFGFFVYESENVRIQSLSPSYITTESADFSDNLNLSMVLDTSVGGVDSCYVENNKLYINPPIIGDVAIYFRGIQPNEWNVYEVEYGINNTENGDFSIIITSETNKLSPMMLSLRYSADNGYADILYAENSLVGQFFASPYYRNDIDLSGQHKIKTEFNYVEKTLLVTIDDVLFCSANIPEFENNEVIHFAGGIISTNFIIEYLHSNIVYMTSDNTEMDLFSIIASILVWNVDSKYLPLELNLIFIKIPMLFLGISTIFILRGVS